MTTLEHKKYGTMGSEFIVHHCALRPKRLLASLAVTFVIAAIFQLYKMDVAVLWAMCACLALFLTYRLLYKVSKESLLVMPGVGVQVKTQYYLGGLDTRFFDKTCVRGIIINEAVTMHSVLCYLAVLTTTSAGHEHTLYPLFTQSWPGQKDLVYIYQAVENMQLHHPPHTPPPPPPQLLSSSSPSSSLPQPASSDQTDRSGRGTGEVTPITHADSSHLQQSQTVTRNRRQKRSSKC